MKIAIPTQDGCTVGGHAGQARHWLVYDIDVQRDGTPPPRPSHLELAKGEVLHHFPGDAPHPLDGVSVVVTASAGEGFVRHMGRRGARVRLTGETDPAAAIARVLAGEALPKRRFDITTAFCKIRDLFSRR